MLIYSPGPPSARKASTMSCHNARSLNPAADHLTKVINECVQYPVNFVQFGYFTQPSK